MHVDRLEHIPVSRALLGLALIAAITLMSLACGEQDDLVEPPNRFAYLDSLPLLDALRQLEAATDRESHAKRIELADSILRDLTRSGIDISDSTYVSALYRKAASHFALNQRDSAIACFQRLILVEPKPLPANHEAYILPYAYVGYMIGYSGVHRDSASKLITQGLALATDCGVECDSSRSRLATQYANILEKGGDTDTALVVAKLALELSERVHGSNSVSFANANNTMGLVYHKTGDHHRAEIYYGIADEIYRRSATPTKDRASTLGSLGIIHAVQGEWEEAADKLMAAKRIREDLGLDKGYEYTRICEKYALALQKLGEDDLALTIARSALEATEDTTLDPQVRVYALRTLSEVYCEAGDFETALKALKDARRIESVGFQTYWQLAKVHRARSSDQIAQAMLDSALHILDSLGRNTASIRYLPFLVMQAEMLEENQQVCEADSLYSMIEGVCRSSEGFSHHKSAALTSLAQHYRKRGFSDRAVDLFHELSLSRYEALGGTLMGMSERNEMRQSHMLDTCLSLLISSADISGGVSFEVVEKLIDGILSSKSALTESLLRRSRRLRLFAEISSQPRRDSLQAIHSRRASLLEPDFEEDSRIDESELEDLRSQELALMQQFTGRETEIQELSGGAPPRASDLLERLQFTRRRLLEFVEYDFLDENGDLVEPRYLSYFIDENGQISIHDLGATAPIDSMVENLRGAMLAIVRKGHLPNVNQTDSLKLDLATLAKTLIPQRLLASSKPRTLIISPDGKLNMLPFEALWCNSSHYLIEQFPIHYVGNGREILPQPGHFNRNDGLLTIANPLGEYLKAVKPNPCIDFAALASMELRFSENEARAISDAFLSQRRGQECKLLTREKANEHLLKLHAGEFGHIHIAAHGYYVPASCVERHAGRQSRRSVNRSLAGIVLSRANAENPSSTDELLGDGILTAGEVTMLDLTGVRTVTLATCESGIGQTIPGDGVHGLRRSFLIAGAESVISALWEVDDRTSASNVLPIYADDSRSLARRLQEAKVSHIQRLRNSNRPDHPFSWAPYVVYGNL